jgi:hypothetical protein
MVPFAISGMLVLDVDSRHPQLGLDRIDDFQAQVHGIADRPLLVVVIGKRDRGVAVADRDRAAVLDFRERAFLRGGGIGESESQGSNSQSDRSGHVSLLVIRSNRRP